MTVRLHGLLDFIELSGVRNRAINGVGCVDYVGDILVVDFDGSARGEVPFHHHRRLIFQSVASRSTAFDGFVYLLRIHAGFGRKGEGFRYDGDVVVYDNLIGQLADASGAGIANQGCLRTVGVKDRRAGVEILLVAAHHDGQRAGLGAALSAGYRRI